MENSSVLNPLEFSVNMPISLIFINPHYS